ncbi:MAG: sugar ABC transporter substrate-binding protein [Treponema sp.]|jgi:ribose transport system substrate-binding protein|nr:sugar ABC transporter substrate-binding protein [Treponema sp.]
MKRFISVMVFGLMMLACVTGTFAKGGGEQAQGGGKQLRVAVILKTLSSPYWQMVLGGAENAGKEFGVKIEAFGPPTEDGVEEQINMVQNAIQNKFDAIVFSPCQPPTAVSVLNQAKQAGIPVVIVDTPMPADFQNYITYIGSNNYQIGVIGAQEMLKVLTKGAKVLVLEGAPGNPSMTDRADGAEKVLRDAGMEIVSRQPAYSDRDRAYGITQNVLQTTNIDAVWGSNDDQAAAALRAITQTGKNAVVVGVDGNQFALESVRDGGLYATVAQSADQMGYLGVQYAIDAVNGKTVEKKIDAPTPVVTKANVGTFLK